MRAIVIPAYNEESTIESVIMLVRGFCDLLIVVDDCSTDTTSDICDRFEFVYKLTNPVNRGYEYSLLRGLHYAFELNASSILTIDADGQHPVHEIPRLFDLVERQGFSVAIGARSSLPRLSEYIFSIYSFTLFGVWDITSGLKCYNSSVLINNLSLSYSSIGTYYTMRCLLEGKNVKSYPICVNKRVGGFSRFGFTFAAEWKIFLAFVHAVIEHIRFLLSIPYFR